MSAILRFCMFLLLCLSCGAQPLPRDCGQMVLVVAPDWDSPEGTLVRWERGTDSNWQPVGAPVAVVLGRTGLAWGLGEYDASGQPGPVKKEGDGRAPAGVFAITRLWQRPAVVSPGPEGFRPQTIFPDTIAVDDPLSRSYNRILRTGKASRKDWKSWEKMDIPDYDRVLVVAHNLSRPIPGRGSCIFIHRWEDSQTPTSGCTAMQESDLNALVDWLKPVRKPRLVQLPESLAREWRRQGWLPEASAR